MSYRNIWLIGFATLLIFGGGGLLLIKYVNNENPLTLLFNHPISVLWQILYGILFGFLASWFVIKLMNHPFMLKEREFFQNTFKNWQLTHVNIVFISLAAGFGEEIFFRGFLQFHLGIFPTAIIFVAIHGYLNPKRDIFLYGFLMVFIIALMGWSFERIGPWSAITAHFLYDWIILIGYLKKNRL